MVHVSSETGRLRRVLMHAPGLEVDHMVPSAMDELLYDDVLFGDLAREEHALFRRVLQVLGVEVVEAFDLLVEVLEKSPARDWIRQQLAGEISDEVMTGMQENPSRTLAGELISGVRIDPAARGAVEARELFGVPPLPNWCFQRDPQVVLDTGILHCSMASPARFREAVLARALFRFHPELTGVPVLHEPALGSASSEETLEGGDVLVVSPEVVVVGQSERTNREGILSLVRSLRVAGSTRWLLVVRLPRRRAYMHLDTVITPIDRDAALVYPPVILGDGPERARIFEVDLKARDPWPVEKEGGLLEVLEEHGVHLEPVLCGGTDPLRQQREQWTDGANALAVAPGVIVLYERNVETLAELARRGYQVVAAADLVLGKREWDLDVDGRLCVVIPAHELSRARGGPHCLTHPLQRDDL